LAHGVFDEDANGFVLDLEPCTSCPGSSCTCPVQGPPRGVEPKDAKGVRQRNTHLMKVRASRERKTSVGARRERRAQF
jgi:hypothetical protein